MKVDPKVRRAQRGNRVRIVLDRKTITGTVVRPVHAKGSSFRKQYVFGPDSFIVRRDDDGKEIEVGRGKVKLL